MTALLKMLASVSESSKTIKLALVGRKIPDIKLKQGTVGTIMEMELTGLDMDASLELLKERGMVGPGIENIASKSGGHPLYLTLVEPTDNGSHSDNVSTLLAREIFVGLSESEKVLLHNLSVFRMPVRGDAFVMYEEDFEALENLEKRSIVLSNDGWTMHNLFRDFFYERQTRADREARHESAAEYYNDYSSDIPGKMEEAYHLFMARDYESALLLLTTQGPDWLKHGYQDEILRLSSFLPDDYDNQEERYEALMLKASALDQIGEWEEAKRCYETVQYMATSEKDDERSARALRGQGAIYYRRGELDKALETFEKALSETLSPVLRSEIQNGIGVVQWKLGQPQKARRAYDSDLKISEEVQDLQGQARALNNLGILDREEGKYDKALERYSRALDFAQQMSAKKLVAILYSNIADAYKSKGEVVEAQRFYERCLELSEDLRFDWQTAEAYRGMADIVEADRDKYLKKALRIFDRLGAKEDAKAVRVMMK
jgi:tetratricopeptide (TPR) repeat protein